MAEERRLSADDVAARTFATSFRGFEPNEVRAYLGRVADELRAAVEREEELLKRLDEAEKRAASPDIDEDTLLRLLGDETARVMRSAREAATDLRARAEDNVEVILRDAHDQAAKLRAAAESVLAERSAEAEQAAARIRASAEEGASAVLTAAEGEAESVLAQAREQGRSMVLEAQAARERILADLNRRRRIAHVQVEQLRAGRDRLLVAYRLVRTTLEEVTEELQKAESEARHAADATARRLAGDDAELAAEAAAEAAQAVGPPEAQPVVEAPVTEDGAEPESSGGLEAGPTSSAAREAAREAGLAHEAGPEREAESEPVLLTTTIDAESLAPVTAEPTHPASVPTDEPRLSSLRVLRRHKEAEPAPEAESMEAPVMTGELSVVEPPGPDEGVRILPAEEGAEPAPEPAPAREPEPAREAEPAREPAPEQPAEAPKAGDIFARIRAERAESVEHARTVLAEPEHEPKAEHAPEHEPAAEAEPEAAEPEAASASSPATPGPVTPNADERALQQRDEAVADLERALSRKLKRSLQNEQNDLLDRLRGLRGRPAVSALPEPADHAAPHVAVAAPFLRQAAGAEIDVADVAAELVDAIVAPLRRQLERAMQPAADDEETAVAERIGMAYREWKGDRIERLAGDAVVAAWSRARFAEVPHGTALRWVVDDGGAACPDCDDNALAGPTVKGEEFPTGQQHPPAHAGCRCLLVRADG